MKMDKMHMESPDMTEKNIDKIAELFPNCITESLDTGAGGVKRAIKFDLLRQMLSRDVVEGDEAYEFTWVGKKAAIVEANKPIRKTLRPCPEESVEWDTTENLYIEGDNIDVLKLLQESYLGQIRLIYIDPPYNTGSDRFVYPDSYVMGKDEYEDGIGLFDEDGNVLFKENNVNNPRFHSVWCSMLYSRLILSRNLLSDDGAIFISIDDNEVDSMLKVANDVFGEDNFINVITVKTKIGGVSGSSEGKSLKDATEFIGVYAKNKTRFQLNPVYLRTKLFTRIKSYEIEGKSWKYTSVMSKLEDKVLIKEDAERGVKYYGYKTLETMSISAFAQSKGITEEEVYNRYADRIFQTTNAQSSVRQTVMRETNGLDYPMIGLEYVPIKGKNEGKTIEVLYKGEQRRMMMFLSDAVEKVEDEYVYLDKVTTLWDDIQYNNLTKEGSIEFPNGKKPIKLLQRIIEMASDDDSIILDFFSGSASTAHAVMQTNAEKGSHRKFIMVQIPEETGDGSDFRKAGFSTICDIGKERIRRSSAQISDEFGIMSQELDMGFRVFKLDDGNMNDVYYSANEYSQNLLSMLESNVKADRTDLDLLFGCLLEWGLPLSLPYTSEQIEGCTVHTYNEGDLIACFDENIPNKVIKEIARRQPLRAVFRDSSFASSPSKINVGEIFKMLAPDTRVKII
jgi:adenine-specific DNA-methyltransferase